MDELYPEQYGVKANDAILTEQEEILYNDFNE